MTVDCPFCRTKNVDASREFSTENTTVDCPVCGRYLIGRDTIDDLPAEYARNRNKLPARHIVSGILRDNTERGIEGPLITFETLPLLSDPGRIPSGINGQLRQLMRSIARKTEYYGHSVTLEQTDYSLGFCRNHNEFAALLRALKERGWLEDAGSTQSTFEVTATISGLSEVEESRVSGGDSDQAFVAMQFSDEMIEVYNKYMKPAIADAGYRPLTIMEKPHNNDVNSEIIAEIRRSKFLVADLTGHRGGVYFEAGLAFGLNLPVIWTCRTDWFNQVVQVERSGTADGETVEVMVDEDRRIHFDVDHYPFLVWETGETLAKMLNDHIRATII